VTQTDLRDKLWKLNNSRGVKSNEFKVSQQSANIIKRRSASPSYIIEHKRHSQHQAITHAGRLNYFTLWGSTPHHLSATLRPTRH
jgi:hypothetical protein